MWFHVCFDFVLPLAEKWNLTKKGSIVSVLLMGVTLFACLVLINATMIFALKAVFRLSGLLTSVEAKSFPLQAGKGEVAPWPDSWQEPCDPERRYFDFVEDDGTSVI